MEYLDKNQSFEQWDLTYRQRFEEKDVTKTFITTAIDDKVHDAIENQ